MAKGHGGGKTSVHGCQEEQENSSKEGVRDYI